MVHTPATTALGKHREEKMQGQGTQVPHSGFKPFRPTCLPIKIIPQKKNKTKTTQNSVPGNHGTESSFNSYNYLGKI